MSNILHYVKLEEDFPSLITIIHVFLKALTKALFVYNILKYWRMSISKFLLKKLKLF